MSIEDGLNGDNTFKVILYFPKENREKLITSDIFFRLNFG